MLIMVLTKRINSVGDQETEMMDHHKDQMENKDHHRDHLKDLLEDLVEDLKVLMDSHKVQAADQDSQDHQVAQVEDQADLYQKDLDLQEDQEHKADQVVQAAQEADQADQFLKVDQVVLQADLADSQVADPVHDQAHQVKMDQMVKDQQVVDQDLVLDLQVVKTVPADDQAHDPVHPVVKKVVPVADPDPMDDQDQALTLEKVRNKCLKEC